MNDSSVTIVRIYLHEAKSHQEELLNYLHDEANIRGVTVFRGVTGFGTAGKFHTSTFLDMSLDLPVVIEFFDEQKKVEKIIEHLNQIVKPGHLIYWSARTNIPQGPGSGA